MMLLLLAGCRATSLAPPDEDANYYPLEPGRYVVYAVQEERYSLSAPPVRQTYQVKEAIGPAYTDVARQPAYRLLHYHRSTDAQPWQADSVGSVRRSGAELIRTEQGQEVVKLMFPIRDDLSWNGNRYNATGNDTYTVRNSGRPFRVVDTTYARTATVVMQNDSTLVAQHKRIDVYGQSVGLIYKERVQVQFCASSPGCVGTYQIDYGIRQIYRIRSYGRD